MKITVDLSEKELKEVCQFTGIKKKGPAIRKVVADALMMQRRRAIAQKFISGEWSAEFAGFEESRAKDRQDARRRAVKWK